MTCKKLSVRMIEEGGKVGERLKGTEKITSLVCGGAKDCPSAAWANRAAIPPFVNGFMDMSGLGGLIIGAIIAGIIGPTITEFLENFIMILNKMMPGLLIKALVFG